MITLDFVTIIRNQVTAIQASANKILDFTIGSVLRAMTESTGLVVLWLESLLLQLLARTRATTSIGADLDSWMADYNLYRTAAAYAVGSVTFSRFTSGVSASIPVGYNVEVQDGSYLFVVTRDTAIDYYDIATDSYIIPSNVLSITVPIKAVLSGINGNAVSGLVNTLTQSIVGVDTVVNTLALTGGADAETDKAFRARFVLYIASLSKATKSAISFAVSSVQSGLVFLLLENQDHEGNTQLGHFIIIVDDGTGYPTSNLISRIYNAVDAVRGFTITFNVFPPDVIVANVSLLIPGVDAATKLQVKTALLNAINGLGLGVSLPYQLIATITYNICGVFPTDVTINGDIVDINTTTIQTVKSTTSTVTVG